MNAPYTSTVFELLNSYAQRIAGFLDQYLQTDHDDSSPLHEAMRYAVMNGGKRIRPALVYATGEMLQIDPNLLDLTAASIEIIHCYSLVHDDLPAMDDDDLRRGIPTCHKAFDEATAILAGDALQALAFGLLVDENLPGPDINARCKLIQILAMSSGSQGMAGGQALDLSVVGTNADIGVLENMHMKKTGSLIHAAIMMVAAYQSLTEDQYNCLSEFGCAIGLAFQIRDDILDQIGTTSVLGKPQGSDLGRNKPTYVSLLGLEEAQNRCERLLQTANQALQPFDSRADSLRQLSAYIISREF